MIYYCFRMPNKYIRKTDRSQASVEIYELAAKEVDLKQKSFRDAASSYNLNYSSIIIISIY